jgi:hypothetical protein
MCCISNSMSKSFARLLGVGDRATLSRGGRVQHLPLMQFRTHTEPSPSALRAATSARQARLGLSALALALIASPAYAQAMDPNMPGMDLGHMDHSAPAPVPAPKLTPPSLEPSVIPTEAPMDPNMPGMEHGRTNHSGLPKAPGEVGFAKSNDPNPAEGSGTSRLPGAEGGHHGLMTMSGKWMLMAHGYLSTQYTKATGPRGDDKVYATSMAMLMAERNTSFGRVQFKSMFSLEPLMQANGYPNLFATGETANGLPLVDRQHPHDLFMELTARVDFNTSFGTAYLYGGPVGEPALGPSAFMHRASAKYNSEPPITHHWFDSTHITYGVATIGLATNKFQLEGSVFTGREPDEYRWNLEKMRFDSWSVRATWNPSSMWALEVSYGELKEPEFNVEPGVDQHKTIASVHYANGRGLSAMLGFAAKQQLPGDTTTAWLGEANWDIDRHNSVFGRVENVANNELFPNHAHPLHDQTFRVTKFQLGYARRIPLGPFELALGGTLDAFAKPAALDAFYGKHPLQYTVFGKLTLGH